MIKPLFKWAGGKSKMLKYYQPYMPQTPVNTYSEPFFGGGAMFAHVIERYNPQEVWINDINSDIINVYRSIAYDFAVFCQCLQQLSQQYLQGNYDQRRAYYYKIRDEHAWDWQKWSQTEQAAVLYFLMRTGFNGIWQINKNTNNRYGTPCGLLTETQVYDADNLQAWHDVFQQRQVHISTGDWSQVPICDFVFCDPPYRDSFADYNQPFSDEQLLKLIKVVETHDNVWLCNRDSGDGFFDNVQANVVKIPVTYTAGRRKKTQDGFQAKKATEVLIFRNQPPATPNVNLFYQEPTHG